MKTAAAPGKPGRLTSALSSWPRALLGALHHYRFALLWAGHIITCATFLAGVLLTPYPPYVIREYLINSAGGAVRRSLGGDLALLLSSSLGGAPAFWAWAVASAAATLLVALVIRLYQRLPDDPSFLLLTLSPVGLLFFAYDDGTGLRKEVFAYLALAISLSAALVPDTGTRFRLFSLLASATFLISLGISEANLFLWPAFALTLALNGLAHPSAARWLASLAVVTLLAVLAHAWYVIHLPPPDIGAICQAAWMSECKNPFAFLDQDLRDGMAYVRAQHPAWHIAVFLGYFGLGAVPFFFLRMPARRYKTFALGTAILCLAVLPLWLIAEDWGRWIFMVLFPLNLLSVTAISLGLLRFNNPLPYWGNLLLILGWTLDNRSIKLGYQALFLLIILLILVIGHRIIYRLKK